MPGIAADFYSLQKGQPAESEFARLMANGWDVPKIHLPGALAKPVWILNRFDDCWRRLLDRADSPWYPTARQYRQEEPGD